VDLSWITIETWAVLGVLLLAGTFQAVFGFGSALIAVPLLLNLVEPETIAPLLALFSLTIAVPTVSSIRGEVQFGRVSRLLVGAAVGVPFGVYLSTTANPDDVKILVGITIFLASLVGLFGVPEGWSVNKNAGYPFGLLAGVLGGAYNLSGPPLVLFVSFSNMNTQAFRATMHFVSIVLNVLVVGWYIWSENFPIEILQVYLLSLPVLVFNVVAGGYLSTKFDGEKYKSLIFVTLLVSAVVLIYTAAK